ncbi:hypothetical protein PS647_04149 [Pseudomonas fluorescens]|nr:hypothetical protein PS647_04149 [Pseudomonas fluorescens]
MAIAVTVRLIQLLPKNRVCNEVLKQTKKGATDLFRKYTQVDFVDENADHSDWIFFDYVIVQALRQQRHLRAGLAFNESLHDRPGYDLDDQKIRQLQVCSHRLDPKLPLAKGRNRPEVDGRGV